MLRNPLLSRLLKMNEQGYLFISDSFMARVVPDIVNERLSYNQETGDFLWKYKNKSHPRLYGRSAGAIIDGYLRIKINSIAYPAHRIAWFMVTNQQPKIIDHINGNKLDNRFSNLRSVTFSQNAKNHGKSKNGSNLPCGVRLTAYGKYVSRITLNKRQITIGTYDDVSSAENAYIDKRNSLYGEYSRGANNASKYR